VRITAYQTPGSGAHAISLESQNGGGNSGDTVVILEGGVKVAVLNGWKAGHHGDITAGGKKLGDSVQVTTGGAVVEVASIRPAPGTTAAILLSDYLQGIVGQELQNINLGTLSVPQPSGSEVDVLDQQFNATLATNQGSVQIDGAARGIITKGGRAVVFVEMNQAGQFDQFKADMDAINQSVTQSLPN
jgi:hypothetical protein